MMNIFLTLNAIFENVQFFLNSNKIANKTKIKSYLIFLLNPQYFFFGKVILFPLSYLIIEIIEDKINKIK